MNILVEPVGTRSTRSAATVAIERRPRQEGPGRDGLRRLMSRSDWLLEELELQNLAGRLLAAAVTVRRLDEFLEALPARHRPARPDAPTPTEALEVMFGAQGVLLRLLSAARD